MRMHALVKKDKVIYWQKTGVNDVGSAVFAPPIIILCRWDMVAVDYSSEDVVELETVSNTIFPDRVLTIGGYLMLGDETTLVGLTSEEIENPKLLRLARVIKSQSTIPELGWPQTNWPPGYQDEHLTIEVSI